MCAFYKNGQCTKGAKCKFSHDLTIERKAEKRSMYVDIRDKDEEETMENWDEEKLKEVVEKKHGERETKMPTTDIVSYSNIDYKIINYFTHTHSHRDTRIFLHLPSRVFDYSSLFQLHLGTFIMAV